MADDPLKILTDAVQTLNETLKEGQRSAAAAREESKRRRDYREQGFAENQINDLLTGEYTEVASARGFFGRAMQTGAPSGRAALSTMGYAKGITSPTIRNLMGLGEMFRMSGSPYAPAGQDLYNPEGKTIGYSSGNVKKLDNAEQLQAATSHAYSPEYLANNPHIISSLSPEEQAAYVEYAGSTKKYAGKTDARSKAALGKAEEKFRAAIPAEKLLAQGANLETMTGAADEATSAAGRALSKTGTLASMAGKFGTAMQMGARFVGGPATIAYQAAETAYKTVDAFYDPARSAAGLGYGFSMNPTDKGFQTSLGRSINTKLDAFASFGLSQQQTAAARASIEGMGAGGPGSEKMYDSYYKSMTSVMEDTQMNAQTLSPFYEQFMRGGGTEDEIGKLTKMLKDDLPKAAAASRMSLEGMATMIQKTTEAAAASPYNYRTKTQISQAVVSAQAAGAPPGFAAIASGTNALAVAQTSSRLGIGYYEAMNEGGALQVTAAQGVQGMLGDMTGDEFREFQLKEGNGPLIAATARMYNLEVQDIQKLYDQGIKDFQVSASLNDEFSDSNLGKEKTVKKKVPASAYSRGGQTKMIDVGSSQKVIGKDLDLYKDKGSKVKRVYATSIDAIRESFDDMGDQDALDKFNEDLINLSGQEGKKTWDVLQSASQKIGKDTATDQQGGKDGVITLSDEAKKYFKLEFGSETQNPNPRNAPYSSGGTTVN